MRTEDIVPLKRKLHQNDEVLCYPTTIQNPSREHKFSDVRDQLSMDRKCNSLPDHTPEVSVSLHIPGRDVISA